MPHKNSNRLALEKSPYLLQHQTNPVDWYSWSTEAFEKARLEDKPIFLSIGYSTCYWCHVMEKDSFEHEDVAEVLNKYFVAIKVDREERPDVDQIYMDAVVGLTGHGGWPMSVFLTPDLKPFWGGTFFPKPQFISILNQIGEAWSIDRSSILSSASSISSAIKERVLKPSAVKVSPQIFSDAITSYKASFDEHNGGFGNAPKFPPSQQIRMLLRLHSQTRDDTLLDMAEVSLTKMAHGGIFDQLDGGFHRYTTDSAWIIPHFEKMLYDNALLVPAYLDAFQITGKEIYADVVKKTLEYLSTRMQSPNGGFYTAEDAGEVDREGEFYVWSYKELVSHLSAIELKALESVFDISEGGNFEGNSILTVKRSASWNSRNDPHVQDALSTLTKLRSQRTRPHLDDKILTSWNGLTLSAFARAALVLGDQEYAKVAERCATFIQHSLFKNNILYHRSYRDAVGITGFVEDYAFLIEGLCELYRATFNERWLIWAKELQEIQDRLFWDASDGAYFFSDAKDILYRKKETIDGATPSANSVSLSNLIFLNKAFGTFEYKEMIDQLINHISDGIIRYPSAFSKALQGVHTYLYPQRELVIIGEMPLEFSNKLMRIYSPHTEIFFSIDPKKSLLPLVATRSKQDATLYYLCENQTCHSPEQDWATVLERMLQR